MNDDMCVRHIHPHDDLTGRHEAYHSSYHEVVWLGEVERLDTIARRYNK